MTAVAAWTTSAVVKTGVWVTVRYTTVGEPAATWVLGVTIIRWGVALPAGVVGVDALPPLLPVCCSVALAVMVPTATALAEESYIYVQLSLPLQFMSIYR